MDCSVTKRKGCNYCSRGKNIFGGLNGFIQINDEECTMTIKVGEFPRTMSIITNINYCPICGKEL